VEALRAGKIDAVDELYLLKREEIRKTNPNWYRWALRRQMRYSGSEEMTAAPFNDIRVRIAMQMANWSTGIARNYYLGTCRPYPSSVTSFYMKGWGWPYEEVAPGIEGTSTPTTRRSLKKLLAEAGYPNGFKTNVVTKTTADMAY